MDVWVVQNDNILGVALNVEAAAELVRKPYVAPYIVTWDVPKQDGDDWSITGHFTGVKGYCGDGPQTWLFTKYQVVE